MAKGKLIQVDFSARTAVPDPPPLSEMEELAYQLKLIRFIANKGFMATESLCQKNKGAITK